MSLVWPQQNITRDNDLWVGVNLVQPECQKRHISVFQEHNIRFKKTYSLLIFDSHLTLDNLFIRWRTDWEISGVLL